MVSNITKEAIAISLFTGTIIAFFVFIGNLAKNFLSEKMEKLSKKSRFIFGLIFSWGFFLLISLSIVISAIVLLNQTDFHILFDPLRKG